MQTLGGDEWIDAGRLLSILAPAIIVQGLINICGSLLSAKGRADRLMQGAIVIALVLTQGFVAGFFLGGIADGGPLGRTMGVAWSFTLVTLVVLAVPYWILLLLDGRYFLATMVEVPSSTNPLGANSWG